MNTMPYKKRHFELAENSSPEEFLASLNKKIKLKLASQETGRKTFFDSFDWRLYANNLCFELIQTGANKNLVLKRLDTDRPLARLENHEPPVFSDDLPKGSFHKMLAPVLKMRALLPVVKLNFSASLFAVLNKDQKTVLRIRLEQYDSPLANRLCLEPLRGYDKALERVAKILTQSLNLKPINNPLLFNALKLEHRKPFDYSSKLNIQLDPEMRSDIASKFIYSHLFHDMKANLEGTLKDIDSEYLHDFRVAVRRTRSGLSQLKNVLPKQDIAQFSEFFAWLGQITGPTRDMDVYILKFEVYKKSLPITIREDLNPFKTFLQNKQKKAHKELVKKLTSDQFNNTLADWQVYLKTSVPKKATETHAMLPIYKLANKRIWHVYQQVLKNGYAINNSSPAKNLHDLRKTCKKLRYLMEFFQSLYPEAKIKALIKTLKGFQEVLGNFQDYEVQEHALKEFSEEMMKNEISASTFLAMGVLIQNLHQRRLSARADFNKRFSTFTKSENQTAFKNLFSA